MAKLQIDGIDITEVPDSMAHALKDALLNSVCCFKSCSAIGVSKVEVTTTTIDLEFYAKEGRMQL